MSSYLTRKCIGKVSSLVRGLDLQLDSTSLLKDFARALAALHLNFGTAALFKWSVGINELRSSDHAVSIDLVWTSFNRDIDKVRLSQPPGLTLPQVSNYRHVDIELREALTIKYMKRVQELLTGKKVGEEDEATLLQVVRLEANISRAMLDPAEEREEKEVREVDAAWLQKELPFIDWIVFMEETIGEEVEVVVSSLTYLAAASRLLLQMVNEEKGRKIVQQYLVSRKHLTTYLFFS